MNDDGADVPDAKREAHTKWMMERQQSIARKKTHRKSLQADGDARRARRQLEAAEGEFFGQEDVAKNNLEHLEKTLAQPEASMDETVHEISSPEIDMEEGEPIITIDLPGGSHLGCTFYDNIIPLTAGTILEGGPLKGKVAVRSRLQAFNSQDASTWDQKRLFLALFEAKEEKVWKFKFIPPLSIGALEMLVTGKESGASERHKAPTRVHHYCANIVPLMIAVGLILFGVSWVS